MRSDDVHIAGIEYVLPARSVTLEDLAAEGRLHSRPEALRDFGFDRAWIAGPGEDLPLAAVQRLLERTAIDPLSVHTLLVAGALPEAHGSGSRLLDGFSYPAARLQYECGFDGARAAGVSQAGCLGLMTAVSLGRAVLRAEPDATHVICVGVDVLPPGSPREVLYNLISDGACAVLLARGAGPNRILAERQITKGYYWNCAERGNEIVAAYFPTARTIIRETLAAASLTVDDIALVVPHNVSRRSWEILLQLTGLHADRLFADTIAARGHVISGDNFMNLRDAADAGRLRRGDRVLLFNFGFGASWACMLLEH